MQPIITRLGDLARNPFGTARGFWRRLRDVYGPRPAAAAPAPVEPAPAPTVPEPAEVNWALRSQAELIDHLEQHYHGGLRRDLPMLIDAARWVERDHPDHPAVPAGLADVLDAFASELEHHMRKEETMLFPALRRGGRGGAVAMPIEMMEREHVGHADALARIRALTDDLTLPARTSATWIALYTGLATLERDLRQHIALENDVLFARAS